MDKISFRFGAETYTWTLKDEGRAYLGRLDHMIEIVARAGFAGIEPNFLTLGRMADPGVLARALNQAGLELAAVALALPWNQPNETANERQTADQAIALLRHFPGAILCTVQEPTHRQELVTRRLNLTANLNAVSRRAAAAGVPASFHPNSPHNSISRTAEDYRVILERLDATVTGWAPDVGHIANGGMNPLETMKEYASLINLVHFKDWDGNPEFVLLGQGCVDFPAITRWLVERRYSGWIICEDEGQAAASDPDAVTLQDGRWIAEELLPSIHCRA